MQSNPITFIDSRHHELLSKKSFKLVSFHDVWSHCARNLIFFPHGSVGNYENHFFVQFNIGFRKGFLIKSPGLSSQGLGPLGALGPESLVRLRSDTPEPK